MAGSHETVLRDSRLRHRCLGNRAARLRYRVAGSDVYRYPGDPEITPDDVLLQLHSFICCFYASWYNNIYHPAIPITSDSVVHSYNHDNLGRIWGIGMARQRLV